MKVQTKWFGEIEVSEDKIITFDKGIIGFEDWKKYTLVYEKTFKHDVPGQLSDLGGTRKIESKNKASI